MDREKGARTIVYNTKKDSKEGGRKKEKEERAKGWRNTIVKEKEFYTIDHTIRA